LTAPDQVRRELKRYLEQRREFGESELTLDTLDVDQVLKMLGARGDVPGGEDVGVRREPITSAQPGNSGAERAGSVREAAGASARPAPEPVNAAEPKSGRADRTSGETPASTDWREALRAAGAGPGAVKSSGPSQDEDVAQSATRLPATSPAPDSLGSDEKTPSMPPRKKTSSTDTPSPEWVGTKANAGQKSPASPVVPLDEVPAGIEIPASAFARGDARIAGLKSLKALAREVHDCTRCSLYKTATNGVPGEGNSNADLVCVGEAPGANEDATGRPFVGQAGQLLTKILAAINLSREDVFICNVLKHRPPGNRNPQPEEIEACSPYLIRQLALLEPRVIVAFGTFAAQTLLETKLPLGKLRGQVHRFHGIPLIVTYHPAALLRNSAWKRPTWEDVQLARRLLDRPGNS